MRSLFIISALLVSACAPKKEGDSRECKVIVGPQMITYGDGLTRKSDVTICKYRSGRTCTFATWVNDPTVTYTNCEE